VILPWRPVSLPDQSRPGGEGFPIMTSLTEAETTVLRELAGGKLVVEIGAAFGYSTVALAQVAFKVISIDPHVTHQSRATLLANLELYRIPERRVDVVQRSSRAALPELADGAYSFMFIDGDHTAAGVEFDIHQAIRLVAPVGLIAVHDYDEDTCPDVRPVCDRLLPGGTLTDTLWVWQQT
jgi:predicted O-methyltransferase YrrM